MLLDRNHLLLRDESVPAAKRLRILCRVSIIGRHVFAHDLGSVTRNVEPGLETVLQLHTGDGFCANRIPGSLMRGDLRAVGRYQCLI